HRLLRLGSARLRRLSAGCCPDLYQGIGQEQGRPVTGGPNAFSWFSCFYRLPMVRMAFRIWITIMDPKARPTMAPTRPADNSATSKRGSRGGISSTAASNSTPAAKAPSRNLLFQKVRVKITGRLDLQLKPWN